MKTKDLDFIFISYDEPNAEENWATLKNLIPWAKRVHGVKGSDNAHKEAAKLSDGPWFVGIDGDNIVYPEFLNLFIEDHPDATCYSWCGKNNINGLMYGNGGVKIWKKDFVLNMRTHEASNEGQSQIEFCWERGYKNHPEAFSDTVINKTPFQAWRAGFREGVKMLTVEGKLPTKDQIKKKVYWHNLHRLRMWATVGRHVENGRYAMLGARMGAVFAYSDWNYINVRDFDELEKIYKDYNVEDTKNLEHNLKEYREKTKRELGLHWAEFDYDQSLYMYEMYEEAVKLGSTYFSTEKTWTSSS